MDDDGDFFKHNRSSSASSHVNYSSSRSSSSSEELSFEAQWIQMQKNNRKESNALKRKQLDLEEERLSVDAMNASNQKAALEQQAKTTEALFALLVKDRN